MRLRGEVGAEREACCLVLGVMGEVCESICAWASRRTTRRGLVAKGLSVGVAEGVLLLLLLLVTPLAKLASLLKRP